MKTLTLIIPTYNEANRIEKTLKALKRGFNFSDIKLKEIIFSDDGSTDNTVRKIKEYKKEIEKKTKAKVKILFSNTNRGRGYAVRKAALISNSDYVLYTDADFSIPLFNLEKAIPWIKKNYDLIFGSKKAPGAYELIKRSWRRRIVGYGHSLVANLIFGLWVWDYQGGFKIFSRRLINEVFPVLQQERWGFDMEIIFLAKRLGFKTQEIPVIWGHIENDSKVKLLQDIFRALKDMFQIRLEWLKGKYQSQIYPKLALDFS